MEDDLKSAFSAALIELDFKKKAADAAYQHYEQLADLADSKFREIELLSAQLDKLYKDAK
jgi:hypothetical protein